MARLDTTQARHLVRLRAAGKDTSDVPGYCRVYWSVNAPVYVGDPGTASRLDSAFCSMPNEGVRAFASHVGWVLGSLESRRDFGPVAAHVGATVLVLNGDRDLIMNPEGARAWASALPKARLLTLRGGGHMLYLDDPGAVVRALSVFLDGAWPAGAEVVR